MSEDSSTRRKKMLEELAKLKSTAIAELEQRGYDVRGKTPTQIRQLLKARRNIQAGHQPRKSEPADKNSSERLAAPFGSKPSA